MGGAEGIGLNSADAVRSNAAKAAARAVFARKSADSAFYREVEQRTAANAGFSPRPRPASRRPVQDVIEPGVKDDFNRHQKPTVIFTLDEDGNPELPDARRRGGYFPYLTTGQMRLASDPGMLIDFHV
jgi:hypothetical protein